MTATMTPLTNGTLSRNGTSAPPLSTVTNGENRTNNGRFSTGNKYRRGNPFHRRCAMLREQAVAEISPDEVRALMRKLYRAAMDGDTAATVILLAYLIGKPTKAVDPDAVDDDQWKRLRDVPSQEEFACAQINGIPTEAAIERLKQVRGAKDHFDRQWRPNPRHVLDEMQQQRKRRK
jgi:hypothetical protein